MAPLVHGVLVYEEVPSSVADDDVSGRMDDDVSGRVDTNGATGDPARGGGAREDDLPAPAVETDVTLLRAPTASVPSTPAPQVIPDPAWTADTAAATGVPVRALRGYAAAHLVLAVEDPGCHLSWNTLAAIGAIESGHGTHSGSQIDDDGVARPAIIGPRLDGLWFTAVRDTDGGLHDGDPDWDRAVGPMQFIPSTWARWGADGNGDGRADPHQIDDAALAAGRYLCHYGDLAVGETWRRAVYAYNRDESYVDAVAVRANEYAGAGHHG